MVDNAPVHINLGFDQRQQPGKQTVNAKNHIKTQLLTIKLNSSKQPINYVNSLEFRNIIFHRLFDFVGFCQIYSFVLFSIICSPFVLEATWGRGTAVLDILMKMQLSEKFTSNGVQLLSY